MDAATLPLRVDKSHLITIGERLYAESVELIRELVNNAYDADATEVRVFLADQEIRVEDNGLGMDLDGLREYFTIGTSDKRTHPKSPRFARPRIGQFGIGKFATLSACERFTVSTQRGAFAAEVIFDKHAWESTGDRWDLPMRRIPASPARGDGTTVTLSQLRRRFEAAEVERRILESVPLSAPEFTVFLNGQRVMPLRLPGRRIPFLEGTAFGSVHGEIVIIPAHLASATDIGVEVKVRQVTVRRDLFGAEGWGRDAARIKGEVHADFLPVTADRTGFVRDTDEYRAFLEVMERVMADARGILNQLSDRTERLKASQAVHEAFRRIQRALAKNPDLSPFGPVAYARPAAEGREVGGAGVLTAGAHPEESQPGVDSARAAEAESGGEPTLPSPSAPKRAKRRRPRVRRLSPDAVVKRVKLGQAGVTCCLDHFGADSREAFSEGATIYINRDHPLYVRNSRRRATHTLHVARLLTQEISMMKDPRSPRQAFERQSKLLRDAFSDEP